MNKLKILLDKNLNETKKPNGEPSESINIIHRWTHWWILHCYYYYLFLIIIIVILCNEMNIQTTVEHLACDTVAVDSWILKQRCANIWIFFSTTKMMICSIESLLLILIHRLPLEIAILFQFIFIRKLLFKFIYAQKIYSLLGHLLLIRRTFRRNIQN